MSMNTPHIVHPSRFQPGQHVIYKNALKCVIDKYTTLDFALLRPWRRLVRVRFSAVIPTRIVHEGTLSFPALTYKSRGTRRQD